MRQDIAAEGIPLEKMTAVPMGVRVDMFADAEDAAAAAGCFPPQFPVSSISARSDKVRRLDFLIRVFAQVRAAVPAARLYVVGQRR